MKAIQLEHLQKYIANIKKEVAKMKNKRPDLYMIWFEFPHELSLDELRTLGDDLPREPQYSEIQRRWLIQYTSRMSGCDVTIWFNSVPAENPQP